MKYIYYLSKMLLRKLLYSWSMFTMLRKCKEQSLTRVNYYYHHHHSYPESMKNSYRWKNINYLKFVTDKECDIVILKKQTSNG